MSIEIARFENLMEGKFVERKNRFVAIVEIGKKKHLVHVRDTARLKDLLKPGSPILVQPKEEGKTSFVLIAAWHEDFGWVLTNSGLHNRIMEKIVKDRLVPEFLDLTEYQKEKTIGKSRIDFVLYYGNEEVPMEIKGCTLFKNEIGLFPDAPTKRGIKHLKEISNYDKKIISFLVMSNRVLAISVHEEIDPLFSKTFLEVDPHVIALVFSFENNTLYFNGRIPFIYPVTTETKNMAKEILHILNKRVYRHLFVSKILAIENIIMDVVYRRKQELDRFLDEIAKLGFRFSRDIKHRLGRTMICRLRGK